MKKILLLFFTLLTQFGFSQYVEIDSSFGSNGVVKTSLGDCMAVQKDGKIVLSGHFNLLTRYNQNGSLDTAFGERGMQEAPIGISTIAIQNDGKIIIGGFARATFAIARYNSNGTIDSTFGSNGINIIHFGFGFSEAKQ